MFLKNNPEIANEIDAIIRKELFAAATPVVAETPEGELPDDDEDLLDLLDDFEGEE